MVDMMETAVNNRSGHPSNISCKIIPPIETPREIDGKRLKGKEKSIARKRAMSARALADWQAWLSGSNLIQAAE